MDKVYGGLGFLIAVLGISVGVFYRYKMRKTVSKIDEMLQVASENRFMESSFDESQLSALEMKFAQYLLAAESSFYKLNEERDKIKEWISDISHQTKTPISNLLLYSELLQEDDLATESKEKVEAIYCQSEKLHFLINALVKLSRLENGVVALVKQRNNVREMMEELIFQYRNQSENKGVDIYLEEDGKGASDSDWAVFDVKWTAEAVGNIIDNGIKYTEQGGIRISIMPYEQFVAIRIQDSGIGIAEEERLDVFRRFYRSERVKHQEGIGLGLYVAQEIIFQQGGYIKVKSKVGEGTCFSVYLPKG